MSQKQTAKAKTNASKKGSFLKRVKDGKWHWTTYVFIVAGILVLIPALVLSVISIKAALNTGTPLFGNRYYGDLDPSISSAQMETIKTNVKAIGNVESVEINLQSATLRVNIKTSETVTADQYAVVYQGVYDQVIAVLPVADYFTANPDTSKNQYDLEINVFNINPSDILKDKDGTVRANYIYFVLVKSSLMAEPKTQEVSVPIDAAQAEALRQKVIDRDNPPAAETPAVDTTGE